MYKSPFERANSLSRRCSFVNEYFYQYYISKSKDLGMYKEIKNEKTINIYDVLLNEKLKFIFLFYQQEMSGISS